MRLLPACLLPALALAALHAQEPLTIQDAIRAAWTGMGGLQAGQAMVDKARAEAEATRGLELPTVALGAGLTRTDEPMQVFGTRLDQARITQADFLPASLNHPDPLAGFGASLSVTQPIYAGGRLEAARRAGAAMAEAEAHNQAFRSQQVALAVDQAYFGTQVAQQGLRWVEDTLSHAQELERFVQARVDQGLMLKSEGERAKAFRAQSEAGVAQARQSLASARSALALLMGAEPPDRWPPPWTPARRTCPRGAAAAATSKPCGPRARRPGPAWRPPRAPSSRTWARAWPRARRGIPWPTAATGPRPRWVLAGPSAFPTRPGSRPPGPRSAPPTWAGNGRSGRPTGKPPKPGAA